MNSQDFLEKLLFGRPAAAVVRLFSPRGSSQMSPHRFIGFHQSTEPGGCLRVIGVAVRVTLLNQDPEAAANLLPLRF